MNEKLLVTSGFMCKPRKLQKMLFNRVVIANKHIMQIFFILFALLFALNANAQLPTQDFESGIPATWAQGNSAASLSSWTTSTDGYLSNGAAFLNPTTDNVGQGNTERYYLITPLTTIPANGQLRFYTKQGDLVNHGTQFEIKLSTAAQPDLNGFTTTLETYTEATLTTSAGYEEKVIDIPDAIAPGLQVYIAFILVNNQTLTTPTVDTWFIDNVSMQTEVVCDPVLAANFSTTNITPVSATLNWTHPTETQFEIQVLPFPETPAPTGTVTDNSYDAGSLIPGTQYRAYIKTLCASSSSEWAGPFTFTTPIIGSTCAYPIIVPDTGTVYTYSANINTFGNPSVTYSNQGAGCLPVTQNYLNGNKAFFSYTPAADGLITLSNVTSSAGFNHNTGLFVYDGCENVGVGCLAGTRTSTVNVPGTINNFFVEGGTTYIIVVSTNSGTTASIAFTFTLNALPCAPPSAFSFSDLLQTSTKLSWNNIGDFATSWEYVVQPLGTGVPTGAGTPTNTNVDNVVNTGLAAGTTYELYIRSFCNGTSGAWSNQFKFTTQCAPFSTPYSQDFTGTSSTVPAACWTTIDVNNDALTWTYLSGYATMPLTTNQNSHNDMYVSPQIDFSGPSKRLRFQDRVISGVSSYSILISTTGVGANNFTYVLQPDTPITNTTWQEKTINIPPDVTGLVNIAFVVTPGTGSTAQRINIDNLFIEDNISCTAPGDLATGTISQNWAELTWADLINAQEYRVSVQPAGSSGPGGSVLVSENNYTVVDLEPGTDYEFYVRSVCSTSEASGWAGPFPFTTLCGVVETPYIETFNTTDPASYKDCWTVLDANTDGHQWIVAGTEAQIEMPAAGAPPVSFDDWLISPALNIQGNKALKFKYKALTNAQYPTARFGVEVLISTTNTDPSSFTVLSPLMEFDNTDYIEQVVDIPVNGIVYIAFRIPPGYSIDPATSIFHLDDVKIEDNAACPQPINLVVNGITTTGANVDWATGASESQWQVVVQPAGTGIPVTGELVNQSQYAAGSLEPATQYEVYVRAYCNNAEQSLWVGPLEFSTLCIPLTTPFIETFNTTSQTEQCWKIVDAGNSESSWGMEVLTDPYEGDEAAGMFTGWNGNNNDWLISPTITVSGNQRLRYYYRVHDSFFEEDLEVLLSTTGSEPANFTNVLYTTDTDATPLNNPEWKEKVINLSGYTDNINVAWHVPQKPGNPIGWRGQVIVIDKVIIEDIPTCPDPTNLTVQNIADVQAQLKWESTGTETAWDVYVQPAGLPAPVGDGSPEYYTAGVTANPYTKTGLIAATQYDYYVRAACSSTDKSTWVGPFTFTTVCPIATACEYTFTISKETAGGFNGEIQVIQNEIVVGIVDLVPNTAGATATYTIFLCDGVPFQLLWDGVSEVPGPSQFAEITISQGGQVIWDSPSPIGNVDQIIYEGFASCSTVTCPYPTNLTANEAGVLSWTPGGTETQWEVFVQPLDNGTLPQSGTIVTTPNYTPVAADFNSSTDATYEYFVRAVCGDGDESFWIGPYEFVRNDSSANAITLPVNETDVCEESVAKASFYGANVSAEPLTCPGTNNGDVWYEFEATATAHIIELIDFSGSYYARTSNPAHPAVMITLYHVNGTVLEEMGCYNKNAYVAAYSTATEIGETYKVRLTLNAGSSDTYHFGVCVKTPDACSIGIVNGSFESPDAVTGFLTNRFREEVIPGWRHTTPGIVELLFLDALNSEGIVAYDGGQFIQVLTPEEAYNPTDMVNIYGMYQDVDSSEITQYNYSYAQATRFPNQTLQLFAGPPSGPFVLIAEHASTSNWVIHTGAYNVPEGQDTTRFIFRSKNNGIGTVLDDISFVPNNTIITESHLLDCTQFSTSLSARGTGTWTADENNPSEVAFATPESRTTTVNGLVSSGAYTFYWNTRYCTYSVVVTNEAVDAIPEVESPVNLCVGETAPALTAPALEDHTLAWYTQPTGGTALGASPTPSTVAEGTTSYYVAYVNTQSCEGQRAQIDVVVSPIITPTTEFSYDTTVYCTAGANPVITLDPDFTAGGTFTVIPATGIVIDAATGEVDLAGSTAGTYDISYTVEAAGCNPEGETIVTITVEQSVTPVTAFTYEASYCVAGDNPVTTPAVDFYAGGVYSANPSAGIAIDAASGEIDLTNTVPGTYEVTYTVTAQGCVTAGSTTVTVTINPLEAVEVSFVYESPACLNFGDELVPELPEGFAFGGQFTSATVTVDPDTGVIDLTAATPGTHEVEYTIAEDPLTCKATGTFIATVVLTDAVVPVVEFAFDSEYCYGSANALPQTAAGFTAGGSFTAESGLVINSVTGEIDMVASVPGTYSVTYTVEQDELTCNTGGAHSVTVTIGQDLSVTITQDCIENNTWLIASPVNDSFDNNVTYIWRNQEGATVGSNSAEFNVAEYINTTQNEVPLSFTVTVSSGTCTSQETYTVTSIMCEIPRGISPNEDGLNDSFNLSSMGVTKISIFNRYGKVVYDFEGTYTNQWHGQDNKGNELPVGTYFYSLTKNNGESVTGWVYINKEY